MRNGNDPRLVTGHFGHGLHRKTAIFIHRKGANNSTGAFGDHLPRHDIGVMFGNADQNFVTRLQSRQSPAMRNHIQGHCRARSQHNLVSRGRADKSGNFLAHSFIGIGRRFRQKMQAAMHIRIGVSIGRHQSIHHLLRFLRRCCRVQIYQWLAMNLARQDRKIGTDCITVKGRCHMRQIITHNDTPLTSAIQRSLICRNMPARAACSTTSIASSRNAAISMARAFALGMPRLVR